MPAQIAILLWLGELLLLAALAATPRGAALAFAIALFALLIPAGVAAPPLDLALLALAFLWGAVRAADLALEPIESTFVSRLVHMAAVVDLQWLSRSPPRLDVQSLRVIGVAAVCSGAALWLVMASAELPPAPHFGLRWLGGAVLMLAVAEGLMASLRLAATGCGWTPPPLHDSPHLARSVGEFWGRRWNRIVSEVLRAHAFVPLARRSPTLALITCFALSALMHAYLIGVGLGAAAALAWAAFFMLQPGAILAERRLGVRRWAPWARHTWSVGVLGLLSPLMTEPGLRLVGL